MSLNVLILIELLLTIIDKVIVYGLESITILAYDDIYFDRIPS